VALVAVSPQLLAVTPSLPVTSVAELIAYAKEHPGKSGRSRTCWASCSSWSPTSS
jgi:tripartite-type tricarboxylate transporter receptor subunit TctC